MTTFNRETAELGEFSDEPNDTENPEPDPEPEPEPEPDEPDEGEPVTPE